MVEFETDGQVIQKSPKEIWKLTHDNMKQYLLD